MALMNMDSGLRVDPSPVIGSTTGQPKIQDLNLGTMQANIQLPQLQTPTLPGIPDAPVRNDLTNRAISLGTERFIGPQLHSQLLGGQLGNIARGRESAMSGLANRFAARGGALSSPLMGKLESNIAAQGIGQGAQAARDLALGITQQNRQAAERGTQIGQQTQQQLLGAWGQGLGAQNQLAGIGAQMYGTQAGMLPTYLNAQMQPANLMAQLYGTNLQAYPSLVQSQFIPSDIMARIYAPYLAAQASNVSGMGDLWRNLIGDMISV